MLFANVSIPIFTKKVESSYDLKTIIKKYREENPNSNTSNVNAWHRVIGADSPEPAFHEIVKLATDFCNDSCFSQYQCEMVKHSCINMWVMDYDDGSFTVPHHHYPADYSCIYYVDVDENSPPLIIEDTLEVKPENELMILFPGFINHKVLPSNSKRVAISFNMIKSFTM